MSTDWIYTAAHLALFVPPAAVLFLGGCVALILAVQGRRGASAVAGAAFIALLAELAILAMWQLRDLAGLHIDYQTAPWYAMQGVSMAMSAAGPTLLAFSALWGRRVG